MKQHHTLFRKIINPIINSIASYGATAWLAFAVGAILLTNETRAHVLAIDSSGRTKRWASATPEFFTNHINNSGMSYSTVFTALTNALSYWKHAQTTNMGFDYWQGSTTVSATVAYDGRNTVMFLSQASGVSIGSGVIGVTYMYSSGFDILETDIVFNDRDFTFTTNSSHTTNLTGSSNVYFENVATHEFGHAYGLSHSNSLQSTMMWQEARGQAKPSCDDLNGMAVIYPNTTYTSQVGHISGTIRNNAGTTAVFGAYVHAISRRRGVVVASAVTDNSGNFTIYNLEPGSYSLMVEPFTNIISALCGGSASGCYYGTANAATTCGGSAFRRFFVESSAGYLQNFTVSAASTTSVGTYNVSCSTMSQQIAGTGAIGTSSTILNAAGSSATSIYGVFSGAAGADVHYYRVANVPNNGVVKATALAFSLYSKADVSVAIVNAADAPLGATVADVFPAVPGVGMYVNHDSTDTATITPSSDVYIRVSYVTNFAVGTNGEGYSNLSRYPGPAAVDSLAFYNLVVTVNDATALVSNAGDPYLANNFRCERTYSFTAYTDRGTPPANAPISSASTSSGSGGGGSKKSSGGCGALVGVGAGYHGSNDDGSSGGSAPFTSMVFSAWGMLFWLLLSRLAIKAYRR